MVRGPIPDCLKCVHYGPNDLVCDAFPDGIPVEILSTQALHTTPYPGDNGIQFEPIEEPSE